MTKFATLQTAIEKAEKKSTVFTKYIAPEGLDSTPSTPMDFDNVIYLGFSDRFNTDIFFCKYDSSKSFGLFTGIKGDEFE